MNKEKVYCGNCKWFCSTADRYASYKWCNHPKNRRIITNFEQRAITGKWKPQNKNKHNDCPHYEDSFWYSFWK